MIKFSAELIQLALLRRCAKALERIATVVEDQTRADRDRIQAEVDRLAARKQPGYKKFEATSFDPEKAAAEYRRQRVAQGLPEEDDPLTHLG